MSSAVRRVLLTVAALTACTLAAAFWLAAVMIRTPQHCGWCGNEHLGPP